MEELGLVPLPARHEARDGLYEFGEDPTCSINVQAPEAKHAVARLAAELESHYGLTLRLADGPSDIRLHVQLHESTVPAEGYRLDVSRTGVSIEAADVAGIFYGIVTLGQLMDAGERLGQYRSVPSVYVEDAPCYRWRGMMLDVGRYFFPVAFIKRYIDLMALHKMNTFHWHLTEDAGWRIEIKKYPRLTEVGAWRSETPVSRPGDEPPRLDGVPHGGFYTQEQVREVVQHAASRFVSVVPEIEMPGHCVAALGAYPELSCTGGPFEFEVSPSWGVQKDVYCAGNPKTFEFLEQVLDEVISLFPSAYVHIGGDECPKDRWRAHDLDQQRMASEELADEDELQSWFIRQVASVLGAHNRRLIGWDEILEGGLVPDATVMSWRGVGGGVAAANAGHDVVMTPTSHCYFDYYQSELTAEEPLSWGGRCLTLEQVYRFVPTSPDIDADKVHHVLGGQGNVWTEYMPTVDHVEYMSLPRMSAMAEALWTPADLRGYEGFLHRLEMQLERWDRMGVNYRRLSKPVR